MIYVDRNKVPVPEILFSNRAEAARKKALDFLTIPFEKRALHVSFVIPKS